MGELDVKERQGRTQDERRRTCRDDGGIHGPVNAFTRKCGFLDRAIKTIIAESRRFNGKDVSRYFEAYKAEMLKRDIPEARQLTGFDRVVMLRIHAETLELQEDNHNWSK